MIAPLQGRDFPEFEKQYQVFTMRYLVTICAVSIMHKDTTGYVANDDWKIDSTIEWIQSDPIFMSEIRETVSAWNAHKKALVY